MKNTEQKYGTVGIFGPANAGKSTLMNRLIKRKISITSSKNGTTKRQIPGVGYAMSASNHASSDPDVQILYVDHPGLEKPLNLHKIRQAASAFDQVLWVVHVQEILKNPEKWCNTQDYPDHWICVPNATDHLREIAVVKNLLKPYRTRIYPVSARHGHGIHALITDLVEALPNQPFAFEKHADHLVSDEQMACDIVREKLMRYTAHEIPYTTTIELQNIHISPKGRRVAIVLKVIKKSHRAIVIGSGGQLIRAIGTEARLDLERLWKQNVFLQLSVQS